MAQRGALEHYYICKQFIVLELGLPLHNPVVHPKQSLIEAAVCFMLLPCYCTTVGAKPEFVDALADRAAWWAREGLQPILRLQELIILGITGFDEYVYRLVL